jgi:hypothetical protein
MAQKAMGIGAMFLLLLVSVILLPMIVSWVGRNEPHFSMSGFQNPSEDTESGVANVPSMGRSSQLPTFRPDANTTYLCNSPNEDGESCPEGTFCDGTLNKCVSNYQGAFDKVVGYFA